MDRVTSTLDGTTATLSSVAGDIYSANMTAPNSKLDSVAYPLKVTAVGDNGEVTEETKSLAVDGSGIFPMRFIVAKPTGEEQGLLPDGADMDMDIGDTDDFELRVSTSDWNPECLGYGCKLFIPGTEYGGIIQDIESATGTREVVLRGCTWRGMLRYKIIEPPENADHLVLNGELNSVVRQLIGDRFGGLFSVPHVDIGVTVTNWQVDRYVTLYDALMKLVENYGHRLQIEYVEPEGLDYGYVTVRAVPVTDYSSQLEYSREGSINVDIRDCRSGVNHLVCAGEGQNQERIVLHLYVQEDGSIGKTQYYYGLDEIAAVYDYSSADAVKLEENGAKRLKELQNYKKCEMTVEDADLELGDIVAGYDAITDTQVKKPVTQKILKMQNGKVTIDYKIKGDD